MPAPGALFQGLVISFLVLLNEAFHEGTPVPKDFQIYFPSMNNEGFILEVEIILKIDEKLTKFRISVKDFHPPSLTAMA